ncbi:hypothetical protein BC826DRAFT_1018711, partial [Russula brevipes]
MLTVRQLPPCIIRRSSLFHARSRSVLDGFLTRRYQMTSVLGTILNPAADKALVGTLVITLTIQGLLP